jgi:hypothetical protein
MQDGIWQSELSRYTYTCTTTCPCAISSSEILTHRHRRKHTHRHTHQTGNVGFHGAEDCRNGPGAALNCYVGLRGRDDVRC